MTRLVVRVCLRVLLLLAAVGLVVGVGDRDAAEPQELPALDVLVVVDRTTSMSALDGPDGTRIATVRADLVELGDRLPTATIAVATFGRRASTVLPFTTDRTAYDAVASALQVEPPAVGTGSSPGRVVPLAVAELDRAADRDPDRKRLLLLVTDGERTSPETQASFLEVGQRLDAGVVLGYGSARGAVMPLDRVDPSEQPPTPDTVEATLTDPATGRPAVSRLDEDNLERIAAELGVPYVHRTDRASLAELVDGLLDEAYDDVRPAEPERETRWMWALAVLALVLPELRRGWRSSLDARRQAA